MAVGLQGGGAINTPDISDHYLNSEFNWDGTLKTGYFERLHQVLSTADEIGVIVILNFFYRQQSRRF
ncbi:MAG: hypothetical protein MUO62_19555 [Anaerolineales bacterium]|nr:hypothetical protein [Anaerolineales bacterium]